MRDKMVNRLELREQEYVEGNGHPFSWRMATTEQKLAAVREVEAQMAAFGRRLNDVLEEMRLERHQFFSWRQERNRLEGLARHNGVPHAAGTGNASVRDRVQGLLADYGTSFSLQERDDLLREVRQSAGDDSAALERELQALGLPRVVYEAWSQDERDRERYRARERAEQGQMRQALAPVKLQQDELPPASPMLFVERHEKTLRRRLSVPTTPEQRLRILACIDGDDGRRRKKWMRRLNITPVTVAAWRMTAERDRSALGRDWQVPLMEAESAFKAIPDVVRILEDGVYADDVVSRERTEQVLQQIEIGIAAQLRAKGMPEDTYRRWMEMPTSMSIPLIDALQTAKPVRVEYVSEHGVKMHTERPLNEAEGRELLLHIREWVREQLTANYLDQRVHGDWVRYQRGLRVRSGHAEVAEETPMQSPLSPCEVRSSGRARRYGDAEALWAEFKATGNNALRNRLVEIYLPLVKYNGQRIWARLPEGVELDDLVSAGVFGLMDAIDAFDLSRGVKFETYCVPRIRGAMLDELRTMDWVPRLVRAQVSRLTNAIRALEPTDGASPSVERLAQYMGIPIAEVEKLLIEANTTQLVSLSKKWYETDSYKDVEEIHILVDEKEDDPGDLAESREFTEDAMEYALRGFSGLIRDIFILYHIEGYTMKQIGDASGLSESRISQMHSQYEPQFKQRLELRLQRKDPRFPGEWDTPPTRIPRTSRRACALAR